MTVLEDEPLGAGSAAQVHVVPMFDLFEHEPVNGECMCGPAIEAVRRSDGSYAWVVQHHSLDGREFMGG